MINALELLRAEQNSGSEREARRRLSELAERKFAHEQSLAPYEIEGKQLSNLGKRMEIEQYPIELQRKREADMQNQQFRRDQLATQERIAGMRGRAQGRPQIVQTDQGPMQLDPTTNRAMPIMGPDGQPVRPKSLDKALPTSAAQKLMENQQNLRRAEQADKLLSGQDILVAQGNVVMQGDTEATGKKGLLSDMGVYGDKTLNWLDPKGVDARAAVGDLGSLIIHDRSGAAVTAAEFPRLRPFIPLSSDAPDVARKKVQRFKNEYQNIQQEMVDFYKEAGYKVPSGALRSGGGADTGAAPAQNAFDAMPDPRQYEGKTITDTQTNTKWRATGGKWLRAQ